MYANQTNITNLTTRVSNLEGSALTLNYATGNLQTDETLSCPVGNTGITAVLTRVSTSTARMELMGPVMGFGVYVKRLSVYDSTSLEGQNWDGEYLDSSGLLIDDTVYTNTNDISTVQISAGNSWYKLSYFCSNGGRNSRITVVKLID